MKSRTNTFITIVRLDHIGIVNFCLNEKFTMQRRQIIAISRYNRRKKSRSKWFFKENAFKILLTMIMHDQCTSSCGIITYMLDLGEIKARYGLC